MRYLFTGLTLLIFIGCGSSGTNNTKESDNIMKPVSPMPKDSSKQPPSIPNI